jgi:hypothetical protein
MPSGRFFMPARRLNQNPSPWMGEGRVGVNANAELGLKRRETPSKTHTLQNANHHKNHPANPLTTQGEFLFSAIFQIPPI